MIEFKPGYYAYVGSAFNNIKKRVQRHLSTNKKLFWHIDYLLQEAEVIEVFLLENKMKLECVIAENLSKLLQTIPGFGCSDCKCSSHLLYHADRCSVKESIVEVLNRREIMKTGNVMLYLPDSNNP